MEIQHFFDARTWTLGYVVYDPEERTGVVIDSVLDYDPARGRVWPESCEAMGAFIEARGLRIAYVLDTHVHADHLSGAAWFRERYGAQSVIGARVTEVQQTFQQLFNLGEDFVPDGRQFDILLEAGARLDAGPFQLEALHTPGHTKACLSYRIGDALFVGDALFMPDYGTARCDFPGGSADALYTSIRMLYDELPPETRVFTGHDYQPGGRALRFEAPLAEQRASNVQLHEHTTRDEFVAFRKKRDAELAMPNLILPSVQVNIRGGQLPPTEANGRSYMKIPINAFDDAFDPELS